MMGRLEELYLIEDFLEALCVVEDFLDELYVVDECVYGGGGKERCALCGEDCCVSCV